MARTFNAKMYSNILLIECSIQDVGWKSSLDFTAGKVNTFQKHNIVLIECLKHEEISEWENYMRSRNILAQ